MTENNEKRFEPTPSLNAKLKTDHLQIAAKQTDSTDI
jgi:hypothetical protein